MTKEYEQRARIIQQAMESCHSNNPIDCIEWLADKISELKKENANLKVLRKYEVNVANLEIEKLKAQIEKMQEKLKADLIANLEEQIQYSTSPSYTKGMKLFIKSIERWEIKEND